MELSELKKIMDSSKNIVFFGGAGVSTESNIPDFRSADGLYEDKTEQKHSPEEILSHDYFMQHPDEFYNFYRSKMIYENARPNSAHIALAELEKEGKLKAVITQNIDGLHQMAGSENVLELHGSVRRNYCMKCQKFYGLETIINTVGIPRCDSCNGIIKPDVVLYQENLSGGLLERSIEYISNAEVFIIGGTSLTVYPAAGLATCYKGNNLILVNKTSTPYDNRADFVYYGSIGDFFKELT